MPFILFGAIAVSVAIAGLSEVVSWSDATGRSSVVVATMLLTVMSLSLAQSSWKPSEFVPSADQREAGDKLIELMRSYEGRVFAPFFPWYAHLAGQRPTMHIMSRNDVLRLTPAVCPVPGSQGPTMCPTLPERGKRIDGWPDGITAERFSAVIVPALSDLMSELTDFRRTRRLGRRELPYPPTGYRFRGMVVMRPEAPRQLPDDAEMVFGFEDELEAGWSLEGRAWGDGPVTGTLHGQQPVGGYGGERFMNSYHGGDSATGIAQSPVFEVTRPTMHASIGGGRIGDGVRVELVVDGSVVKKRGGSRSEMMREVTWNVEKWVGREATIRLVDASSEGWGHLTVDDVWLEGALGERPSMGVPEDVGRRDGG
jgi:hypothetical protein